MGHEPALKPRKRRQTVDDWAASWSDKPFSQRVIPAAEAPKVTRARGLWDL